MRTSIIIACTVVLALTIWMLSSVLGGEDDAAETAESSSAAASVPLFRVEVAPSEARPVAREIVLSGVSTAARMVVLKAETEGRIVSTEAREGSDLQAGDLVMQIETRDRTSRVAFLEALLQQRQLEFAAAQRLQKQGINSDSQVAQARSLLQQTEADLESARIDLRNTEVRAPFHGVLDERMVEVGDFVSPGTEVAHFVELDPIEVEGFVTEREIGRLHHGDSARVVFANGVETVGQVTFISPVSDEETRTFKVQLTVPNPEETIPAGITAEIFVETAQVEAHFLSPSVLTLNDRGVMGVKTVNAESRVEFYPVQIVRGQQDGLWLQGLPEVSRVITVGMYFTREGEEVEAIPRGSSPGVERAETARPTGSPGAVNSAGGL